MIKVTIKNNGYLKNNKRNNNKKYIIIIAVPTTLPLSVKTPRVYKNETLSSKEWRSNDDQVKSDVEAQ